MIAKPNDTVIIRLNGNGISNISSDQIVPIMINIGNMGNTKYTKIRHFDEYFPYVRLILTPGVPKLKLKSPSESTPRR